MEKDLGLYQAFELTIHEILYYNKRLHETRFQNNCVDAAARGVYVRDHLNVNVRLSTIYT